MRKFLFLWRVVIPFLTLFGISLLVLPSALAQSSLSLEPPKIAPPSPNVSALHAAISYPVANNSGVPDITIPLYTIVSGKITIPIVLRYHTVNTKIDGSINCNVAHGWTLEAGGTASRNINNKPDESALMYNLVDGTTYDQTYNDSHQRLLSRMYSWTNEAPYDTEYDSFNYSFPGDNGSFFLRRSSNNYDATFEALFSPHKPYMMDSLLFNNSGIRILTGFMIRDDNELSYYYGGALNNNQIEMADMLGSGANTSSSWMLTRIKERNGNTVRFTYTPSQGQSFYMDNRWYRVFDRPEAYTKAPNKWIFCRDFVENYYPSCDATAEIWPSCIYSLLLPKEITFPKGKVTFTISNNTISEICVWNESNKLIQRFVFNKTNGSIIGSTLLSSVSIRDANDNEVDKYTLNYNTSTLLKSPSYDFWGYCNGDSYGTGPLPNRTFTIIDRYGQASNQTSGNGTSRTPSTYYILTDILSQINYKSGGATVFNFEPNRFSYQGNTPLGVEEIGSGIRIEKITHKDIDGKILQATQYKYGEGHIPIIPQGEYFDVLTFYNLFIRTDISGGYFATGERVRRFSPKWTPFVAMAADKVCYDWVEEIPISDGRASGKIKSFYSSATNVSFSPVCANSSEVKDPLPYYFQHLSYSDITWKQALLIRKEIYDSSLVLKQKISYEYMPDGEVNLVNMGFHKFANYSIDDAAIDMSKLVDYHIIDALYNSMDLQYFDPSHPPVLLYFYYYQTIGGNKLSAQITENYFGDKILKEEIHYEYGKHYPREVRKLLSDGSYDVVKFKYPYDFTIEEDAVAAAMKKINFISPVLEQQKFNKLGSVETPIEHYRLKYSLINNDKLIYRPLELSYGSNGEIPQVCKRYTLYDTYGNLRSVTENQSRISNYLWGYAYQYPIAIIEGATFEELHKAYTPLGVQALELLCIPSSPASNSLLNMFNRVRNIPNSTITGFIHKPLVGVTQQVLPDSHSNYYQYDTFGRLSSVLDTDKNIINEYEYGIGERRGDTFIKRAAPGYAVTDLSSLTPQEQCWSNIYYDGIFRPIQQIEAGASPLGNDMVGYTEYDALGRKSIEALKYPLTISSGEYDHDAKKEQVNYFNSQYILEGYFASNRYNYEDSPLGRPIKKFIPGTGLYSTTAILTTNYLANTLEEEVTMWGLSSTGELLNRGYYPATTLFKEVVTDYDKRVTISYRDKAGRIIETRMQGGSDTPLITSYVFDEIGNIRYVIPPKAQGISHNIMGCYSYKYDNRNRKIEQYIPDKGIIRYVYDANDRVVFSQNANELAANRWKFMRYDRLGRVVFSGSVIYTAGADILRSAYNGIAISETLSLGEIGGYTNTTQPLMVNINDVLSIFWYDRYSYENVLQFTAHGNDVGQPDGYMYNSNPIGMLTGSKVKVLDGNEYGILAKWLVNSIYYDNKGNEIQTIEQSYGGSVQGVERTSTMYSHTGEITAKKINCSFSGIQNELLQQWQYDPRGRMTTNTYRLNGASSKILQTINYNELGQTSEKTLGCGNTKLKYSYDIRNRICSIGDNNLLDSPFYMKFFYERSAEVQENVPQYAGNISAVTWQHRGENLQSYLYNYDVYGRLTNATHSGGNNEQISYDPNSNITSLIRGGIRPSAMEYSYSGNKITSISHNNVSLQYNHDAAGNMIYDGLRGTSTVHNQLNLPAAISKGGDKVEYIYDALGKKLAVKLNGSVQSYYTGSMVYKSNMSLDYIAISTGTIKNINGQMTPLFNITDNVGSVRTVADDIGNIYQKIDYYPFGTTFAYQNSPYNSHTFNGKEQQNISVSATQLQLLDYGARMYDPLIGRWGVIDPLAEKMYGLSPYDFCGGNPITRIDNDGRIWDIIWDVANVVYDVASAGYQHTQGNHKQAKLYWQDAGFDFLAAAIPFVPAGVTKLAKATDKLVDVAKGLDKVTDTGKATDKVVDSGKTYQTYTKTNPQTGQVYSGRTSGNKDPYTNVAIRDRNHHMNKKGYEKAIVDQTSSNPNAIRGREQYQIDKYGGAQSTGGTSGNSINGINPSNPKKKFYEEEMKKVFKNLE